MSAGITSLSTLLANMTPVMMPGEFVFCRSQQPDLIAQALATFREAEGLSLILPKTVAHSADINETDSFRHICLMVHSSLAAVGLTAEVARVLSEQQISCNVVAALHHDHIFVPTRQADQALALLHQLQQQHQ